MRYWLYADNGILGPYAPEDLSRLPAYSPKSLVCPEGNSGGNKDDWQYAGKIPELSASSCATLPAPGLTEPNDAALAELMEKVSRLERTISYLREETHGKDSQLAGLRRELNEKKDAVERFEKKCAELEERLTEVAILRCALDETAAAEKNVESTLEFQRRKLGDLTGEMARLKDEMRVAAAAPKGAPVAEPRATDAPWTPRLKTALAAAALAALAAAAYFSNPTPTPPRRQHPPGASD